jgi:hypothetical protein
MLKKLHMSLIFSTLVVSKQLSTIIGLTVGRVPVLRHKRDSIIMKCDRWQGERIFILLSGELGKLAVLNAQYSGAILPSLYRSCARKPAIILAFGANKYPSEVYVLRKRVNHSSESSQLIPVEAVNQIRTGRHKITPQLFTYNS